MVLLGFTGQDYLVTSQFSPMDSAWSEPGIIQDPHFAFIKVEPLEDEQFEKECGLASKLDVKEEQVQKSEEHSFVEACPFEVICKIEEFSNDGTGGNTSNSGAGTSSRTRTTVGTRAASLRRAGQPPDATLKKKLEHKPEEDPPPNLVHINIAEEKPFACTQCKKKYTQHKYLNRHIRREHSGIKPHECKDCAKRFVTKAEVRSHSRIHTGERPYACLECGRAFAHREHLKAHIRTHTGERPFKCNECEKTYSDKKTLDMHKVKHTGERPYRCTICEKTFIWPHNLRNHLKIHAGAIPGGGEKLFSCDECGRRFARKCTLQYHRVTHESQMPFVCEQCGRGFARSSSLNLHIKTHVDVKPFACAECGKRFPLIGRLKKHEQVHLRNKVAATEKMLDLCRNQVPNF